MVYLETHSSLGRSYSMTEWEFPSNHYAHMNILIKCKEFLSPIHNIFVEPRHCGEESYPI